jgi:hypothetical protein
MVRTHRTQVLAVRECRVGARGRPRRRAPLKGGRLGLLQGARTLTL